MECLPNQFLQPLNKSTTLFKITQWTPNIEKTKAIDHVQHHNATTLSLPTSPTYTAPINHAIASLQRPSYVMIFPQVALHTKNANLFGPLAHQMLFQGKKGISRASQNLKVWANIKSSIAFQTPPPSIRGHSIQHVGIQSLHQWIHCLSGSSSQLMTTLSLPFLEFIGWCLSKLLRCLVAGKGVWGDQNLVIWKAIPHCLMWCFWRERNARIFSGCELSVVEMKLKFYRTLMDWMSAIGLVRFSNMLEFIDSCFFELIELIVFFHLAHS